MTERERDAVVVGAGPNGLAAAVALAQAGRSVLVLEMRETVGGGARTAELTLPGFLHDVCSAIHPLAVGSPFLSRLPLERHGLEWVHPDVPLAHPLDGGRAVLLHRSVEETERGLGSGGRGWRRLVGPLAGRFGDVAPDLLGPLRVPRHPVALGSFGLRALVPAATIARRALVGEAARALFAGNAAHSTLALERSPSAAFGLVLAAAAHAVGWPMPRGGAQRIPDALAAHLRSLDGEIRTDVRVRSLAELPPSRAVLLDVSPRALAEIASEALPPRYLRRLERFRHGPGACKVDWALDGPIPWRAEEVARAGTVHLGGTFEEIAAAERDVAAGRHAERPFVLLAQQSLFDPTRAPEGRHAAWAYCHVPNGSTRDASDAIEAQVERFAPGFRERVLARHVRTAAELERYDPNCVGGDVNGGAPVLSQLFSRPASPFAPYATPHPRLFLCSASTPPGGGVHGMCGFHAARLALRRVLR